MRRRLNTGFTLVELLTVIAIIALIIQMLLPAVQAAREAARRAECSSHLKQLGLGAAMHEEVHGFYPSGGWGRFWTGDPDHGVGKDQPGSWAYSILPYIEQEELRELGAGAPPTVKEARMKIVHTTPLALMHCPSRRAAAVYPCGYKIPVRNYPPDHPMVKGDYAINAGSDGTVGGSAPTVGGGGGPASVADARSGKFEWHAAEHNGIGYQISEVRPRDVTDGLSKTILLGEKYLRSNAYTSGASLGDNGCLYNGADSDTLRATHPETPLMRDVKDYQYQNSFGSPHAAGCNFVFCDGSVRSVGYEVDPAVYILLGGRNDGGTIPEGELHP